MTALANLPPLVSTTLESLSPLPSVPVRSESTSTTHISTLLEHPPNIACRPLRDLLPLRDKHSELESKLLNSGVRRTWFCLAANLPHGAGEHSGGASL